MQKIERVEKEIEFESKIISLYEKKKIELDQISFLLKEKKDKTKFLENQFNNLKTKIDNIKQELFVQLLKRKKVIK